MKTNVLADRMGQLKAEIARLESELEQHRAEVLASGQDQIEGRFYRLNVTHAQVSRLDTQLLVEKMRPSKRMIAACTVVQPRTTVNVVRRERLAA